jgi:hypothetical protein
MELIKNVDFDGLHLFETSIIGKPKDLQLIDQTFLVIPCYNPIFVDLDTIEKSGNNCYLIFDCLEYFSLSQNIYNIQRTDYLENSKKSHASFDQKFATVCNKLICQGLSEAGIGEFQISILCRNFHIILDEIQFNLKEISFDKILDEAEITDHLLFPNLKEVIKILCDNL